VCVVCVYQCVYIKDGYMILFARRSLFDLKACRVCSACIPACEDNEVFAYCVYTCVFTLVCILLV